MDRLTILLRYATIALGVLLLWIQVSIINGSQNALVICLISVTAFLIMMNRLTNRHDRGPKLLILVFAAFAFSFSVLFTNEINKFLHPGILRSAFMILAIASGIVGAAMAQKRPEVHT